jgi:hypothetical protein
MGIGSFIRHVGWYFYRYQVDWSPKHGDLVCGQGWPRAIEIVDTNWVLLAAAVKLGPDAIVVWPVWGLRKVRCRSKRLSPW